MSSKDHEFIIAISGNCDVLFPRESCFVGIEHGALPRRSYGEPR
jgi:hypothetical protein